MSDLPLTEGAGFYLNATKEPWSKYYNMYEFVNEELPQTLVSANLPIVRGVRAIR